MSEAEQMLLAVKGIIFDLAPDDQRIVQEYAARLRKMRMEDSERFILALSLVSSEIQAGK